MNNVIEIDTKIDNSGVEQGANSVNKSLGKIDNSLSKTSKKMADTFAGNQNKIDTLTSRIERQEQAIEKETVKLKQLKTQYDALASGETTPKSLISLQKELTATEKEMADLIAKNEELNMQLQSAKEWNFGNHTEQELQNIRNLEAQIKALDEPLMLAGERAETLNTKIDAIKMDPTTSDEAKKLADGISLSEQNVDRLNNDLSKTEGQLNRAFSQDTTKAVKEVGEETKRTTNAVEKFGKRLSRLVTAVFVFNVIRKGLQSLKDYMGGLLSTNQTFVNSMNQIKVGLATAFQPIYEAILPALNVLMSALAKAVAYISYFINSLFGKTVAQSKKNAQSMNKQAEAIKGVGKASKDAEKSLASFDKANTLSAPKDSSGGGGGGDSFADLIGDTELPEIDTTIFDKLKDKLDKVLNWLKQTFGPSWKKFWAGLEPNIKNFVAIMGRLFDGLKPIWNNFLGFLRDTWLPAFIEVIDIAGRIFNGLFDTFNLVLGSLIDIVFLPFLDTLVSTILPVLTEVSLEIWRTGETIFNEVKRIFDEVWVNGVIPALELIMYIWQDIWKSIEEFWSKWGKPIFENIRIAVEKTGEIFMKLWEKFLKPVWELITEAIKDLWDNNLKPLLDNIMDMIGELINGALAIYNKFIAPIVGWLVDTLGPVFTVVFGGILGTVKSVIGTISNIINSLITIIKGIIQFITGVFTGDWKKAWEGVSNIFKGIVDGLANIFKAPLNFIIDGINGFLKGLNKIKIPDWVPAVGGKGFNIPMIPRLAKGAVIPPNNEFLAVLGDQKSGNNIETPENLLRQVVREETGGGASNGGTTVVKVYIGDEEIYSRFEIFQEDKDFALNGGR